MDTLTELSENGKYLVGNVTLQKRLGWPDERYQLIKTQLQSEGQILLGRGRGGSVGLAEVPGGKGITAFVSYSHVDEKRKVELLKHLEPLKQMGWIETWHDQMIKPGDEWEETITGHLQSADLILLLVSIDFINSKYCVSELDVAMERWSRSETRVVPVILRDCVWRHSVFGKLQALPKDAKAVSTWADQDEAFTNIAENIRQLLEGMRAEDAT